MKSVNAINALMATLSVSMSLSGLAQSNCSDPLPGHDYSNVGYHEGKDPIPYHQHKATKVFGPGRHVITSFIELNDGDVLRGAGRDSTILFFPSGLKALGAPCGHAGVDCFDWGDAVVRAHGKEIGIENLTIEFPEHDWCHYCGDKNGGYNGISLQECTNCWVKNVTIRNSDSGLFIEGGDHNTVDGLYVFTQSDKKAHLQIAVSTYTHDNLITHFKVYGSSFHGLTANWGSNSNVFADGWGDHLRIEPDHNCNGVGGTESCCRDVLYSNIAGTIESVQDHDRSKQSLTAILWNVGEKTKCPEDAYAAQVRQSK